MKQVQLKRYCALNEVLFLPNRSKSDDSHLAVLVWYEPTTCPQCVTLHRKTPETESRFLKHVILMLTPLTLGSNGFSGTAPLCWYSSGIINKREWQCGWVSSNVFGFRVFVCTLGEDPRGFHPGLCFSVFPMSNFSETISLAENNSNKKQSTVTPADLRSSLLENARGEFHDIFCQCLNQQKPKELLYWNEAEEWKLNKSKYPKNSELFWLKLSYLQTPVWTSFVSSTKALCATSLNCCKGLQPDHNKL